MKTKAKIWYVFCSGNTLYVTSEKRHNAWKVRSITPRAAARKLLRGGTIAEYIAKAYGEWDNPCQPQFEDTPARERGLPHIKQAVREMKIVVLKTVPV